ncbi:MAG: mechanosensitive ion channel [Thaumarchaeota archaeon]|nr:mechanosensitive ion channel [Nitrososphaerota archaeon]MDE1842269.1 mechanosensitive ion channel [Nitrososphaerota archaeon]
MTFKQENYKNNLKTQSKKQKSLQREFTSLIIKIISIAVTSWISLTIFEIFAAPTVGLKHPHIQAAETVVTITLSLIAVIAVRRILKEFSHKIPAQFSAGISFFVIILISLISGISLLYQWNVAPEEILVGGGVTAIIIGIGISTIVGNIISGGLMLTTFPAKIGDEIMIVNDNVRGKVEEVNVLYTKIITDHNTEYIVPNNAIIQGNVRIMKEIPIKEQLPFTEGDELELKSSTDTYSGLVVKIGPKFTTILCENKEITVANSAIFDGQFTIVKSRK